jgi:organic hydroperoxide reductase OsmC/OhrA
MSIAPFPHHYGVTINRDQLVATPRPPIVVGAPPQFGGSDTVWSPEQLLLGAALVCAKTTFDAYNRNHVDSIRGWQGEATGVLDRSPNGPVFTSIVITLAIATTPDHEARVVDMVRTVERTCIVSRALNVPVHIIATVTTGS